MDSPFRTTLPAVLSTSKQPSVTFPLTHGSATARNHRINPSFPQPSPEQPVAAASSLHSNNDHHHGQDKRQRHDDTLRDNHHHRHLFIDTSSLERGRPKPHHKHKHSKSRDSRIPRTMNQLASSAGARGLLPTWSGGKDKDRDGDDGLLRPITQETTWSRWGSDSTSGVGTGSRKGSLIDEAGLHNRVGPVRRREIHSMEDLEQVRKTRKQGEEYLRGALTSIGTLATDITRRLDYTYYNLLEKIAALNSTIGSLQELSDSTSRLYNDFERETTGLDQEIRRQIGEFKGFQPQVEKIEALEERMRVGRKKAEALGNRLEAVRNEITAWEKREVEWQARIGRRLRIFWAVVVTAILAIVVAIVVQNWPNVEAPSRMESLSRIPTLAKSTRLHKTDTAKLIPGPNDLDSADGWIQYPSSLAQRQTSRKSLTLEHAPTTTRQQSHTTLADKDPLSIYDEI